MANEVDQGVPSVGARILSAACRQTAATMEGADSDSDSDSDVHSDGDQSLSTPRKSQCAWMPASALRRILVASVEAACTLANSMLFSPANSIVTASS